MMRFLMIACALLILANTGVFLWPQPASSASHIYPPKTDINPRHIRLNKEVEDKFYAAQSYQQLAERTDKTEINGNSCYRLGPFIHQSNYEVAQAVLFNANVEYQKSTRESKTSNVFRVYLGPFDSKAATDDARRDLKRKNILDHFARREEEGRYVISLGIYTTEQSANDAVSLFDGKLDDVKLKEEMVVLPSTYWLLFSLDGNDEVKQHLSQVDWGESSAKLGKFECSFE